MRFAAQTQAAARAQRHQSVVVCHRKPEQGPGDFVAGHKGLVEQQFAQVGGRHGRIEFRRVAFRRALPPLPLDPGVKSGNRRATEKGQAREVGPEAPSGLPRGGGEGQDTDA